MSNIRAFVSKEDIHQQACEWISKIDRGLSENEKAELQLWSNLSDTHGQTLFDVAALWDDLSALNELKGLFPLRTKDEVVRTAFTDKTRWAVAASFALLVITSLSWIVTKQSMQPSLITNNSVGQIAETQVGEQKPINLADGSVIHLNTNSLVSIQFSENERRIVLQRGEAHFDVAHDESRPFVVEASGNTVTAVGTAFNVQLMNDKEFELLVTEGRVLVKDSLLASLQKSGPMLQEHALQGKGILMGSGEKAVFNGLVSQSEKLSLDQVQRDLAWQQGMLVFQGEPLMEALKEVSRYTSINFEISDEAVKERRVAGYFKAGDINGLLFALKNNFQIDHQKLDDNRIILSAAML